MENYNEQYIKACYDKNRIVRDELLKNHGDKIDVYCCKCKTLKCANNFYLISNVKSAKGIKSYCKSCSNNYNSKKQYTLTNYKKKKATVKTPEESTC